MTSTLAYTGVGVDEGSLVVDGEAVLHAFLALVSLLSFELAHGWWGRSRDDLNFRHHCGWP